MSCRKFEVSFCLGISVLVFAYWRIAIPFNARSPDTPVDDGDIGRGVSSILSNDTYFARQNATHHDGIPYHHFNDDFYQNIIDVYLDILAEQNYDAFNEHIYVHTKHRSVRFDKFSHRFLFDTLNRSNLLLIGDSIVRNMWAFMVSQANNYVLNRTEYLRVFQHRLSYGNDTQLTSKQTESDFWSIYHDGQSYHHQAYEKKFHDAPDKILHWHTDIDWWQYQNMYLRPQSMPPLSMLNHSNHTQRIGSLNVIYANLGLLHHLHLYPTRKYEELGVFHLQTLETYLDELIEIALTLPNLKCVIVRNANPVCSEKYRGQYARERDYYQGLENVSDFDWVNTNKYARIRKCLKEYNINAGTMYVNYSYHDAEPHFDSYQVRGIDFCNHKHTLTSVGASKLNKRLMQYVFDKQRSLKLRGQRRLKLIHLDMFKLLLNQCKYTRDSDGRHYNLLEALDTNVLLNVIRSFCL